MIHMVATSQLRHDTPGRGYYRRKLAAGKTKAEAMRCLDGARRKSPGVLIEIPHPGRVSL